MVFLAQDSQPQHRWMCHTSCGSGQQCLTGIFLVHTSRVPLPSSMQVYSTEPLPQIGCGFSAQVVQQLASASLRLCQCKACISQIGNGLRQSGGGLACHSLQQDKCAKISAQTESNAARSCILAMTILSSVHAGLSGTHGMMSWQTSTLRL